jgi:uncharacterized protein (DUF2062 family)
MNKIKAAFRRVFKSLFVINDSPQRIALGFGVGVFAGILPGMGPLTAIFLAMLTRSNKAAALLGTLLTNTWLSFVVLISSIKIGSALFGIPWQEIKEQWITLIKNFHWKHVLTTSFLDILIPVALGYLLIGIAAGLLAYLTALLALKIRKHIRSTTH